MPAQLWPPQPAPPMHASKQGVPKFPAPRRAAQAPASLLFDLDLVRPPAGAPAEPHPEGAHGASADLLGLPAAGWALGGPPAQAGAPCARGYSVHARGRLQPCCHCLAWPGTRAPGGPSTPCLTAGQASNARWPCAQICEEADEDAHKGAAATLQDLVAQVHDYTRPLGRFEQEVGCSPVRPPLPRCRAGVRAEG